MAAADVKPQEIYMKNVKLNEDNEKLKRFKGGEVHHLGKVADIPNTDVVDVDNSNTNTQHKNGCKKSVVKTLWKLLPIAVMVVLVVVLYVVTDTRHQSTFQSLTSAISSKQGQSGVMLPFAAKQVGNNAGNTIQEAMQNYMWPFAAKQVGNNAGNTVQDTVQKYFLNIGMRQDYQLQECQGSEFKQTFPDVDYALLGYNILKGFPLATGHDPGFTYPIFRHDYSSGGMTADCRYSVPRGFVIIPDVSCVTSFSSTTIQTTYEFSKSLSVSASVSAGGWGVSFSASAGYKQSSSEMSTGESVFIISSANCNYYFSKLITEEAPDFDPVFVKWVHKLNATGLNPELYNEFYETYGTHFPTEVTFGARFIYEHKMSSTKYQSETKSGVNVAVQASYAGLFSAGGGFGMDSEQRQTASDFSKSVETKTITVGAPPPSNGDAMTWASQVKTSPVPTAYKLSSIELLFTKSYMGKMNVDYDRIRTNIDTNKHVYCLYLREKGKVDSCDSLVAGVELKKTRLYIHYKATHVGLSSECVEKCLADVECVGATTCTECDSTSPDYNICYMFKENGYDSNSKKADSPTWQSNIISEKLRSQIKFSDTRINGVARGFENDDDQKANLTTCRKLCIQDAHCVAYTHCDCPDKVAQCTMYSKVSISGLEREVGTTTFFISSRHEIPKTSTTPTSSPTTTSPTPTSRQAPTTRSSGN